MVSLAATAVAAQPARGQTARETSRANADSARLVADLFFRAVADEQWERAASLLDSARMQRLVAEQLRRPPQPPRRAMTIDDFMRDDPNKPRAVAEYELKRYQEQVAKFDAGNMLSYQFSGVQSVDELRSLTPLQAAARYLQAQDLRVRFREHVRLSGCADARAVGVIPPFAFHRIIATALAADSVAYVLHDDGMFASRREDATPLEPMVMQLRWRGGRWLIVPSLGLIGRGSMGFAMETRCDSTNRRGGG
jgi:hypothetical protein